MDTESQLKAAIEALQNSRDYKEFTDCCISCKNCRNTFTGTEKENNIKVGIPLFCGYGSFRFEVAPTGKCKYFKSR